MQTTLVICILFGAVMECCAICGDCLDNGKEVVQLRQKGSDTINNVSTLKSVPITTIPGQRVHQLCRRDYVNANTLGTREVINKENTNIPCRRSTTPVFNFCENCIFCGHFAKISNRKRGYDVIQVRTTEFQKTIEAVCKARGDEWAEQVITRLHTALADLPAADAVYHRKCSVNFRTNKKQPMSNGLAQCIGKSTPGRPKKARTVGRPRQLKSEEAFLEVMKRFESSNEEQVTVTDLVKDMEELLSGEDRAYSVVHMKKRILDHFGLSVMITDANGKCNVVTLTKTVSILLRDFYESPKPSDQEEEKKNIIVTAAKLIKADIKMLDATTSSYPSANDISSIEQNIRYLPEMLRIFLNEIFNIIDPEVRIAAIGQAIVQSARPRTLVAPLQIGLAVQMHHHFGSRFLSDVLNKMGFASSYSELQKYELNAAATHGRDATKVQEGSFIQFIADNVDHDICTIDGHGTFHGMGIIAAVTPENCIPKIIPRRSPSLQEVINLAKIDIISPTSSINSLKFEVLKEMAIQDDTWKLDLLSAVSWPLRCHTPSWSAIMHKAIDGPFPGKSSIEFLPMIDLNPTDLTCINSTLHFVCKEAAANGFTPILTFDQPLFWKAANIIESETVSSPLKSIVLRLGGFHTEMSFAGSIGHFMVGSGLAELLETVYAPNTVMHMLTGKAISRAVRGHQLVNRALTAIMLQQIFSILIPGADEEHETSLETEELDSMSDNNANHRNQDILKIGDVLDSLLDNSLTVADICENEILEQIKAKIDQYRNDHANYRTALLWFQYMDMVSILQKFIKAERTGNWNLHLQTTRAMLPYLAASGHNLYVKSARVYLQQMDQLEFKNPEIYAFFMSGYHVVRRTDKYWAGISSDLAIEQVLMRSMKTSGGLTRGKGMSEGQRAQWLLSMPDCSQMNSAMQETTGVNFNTSLQHKEEGESRRQRDSRDTQTMASFLYDRNPFIEEENLRNIETGVMADSSVDAYNARNKGLEILKSMDGKSADEYTFKRKQQVVTLSEKSSVKIEGEPILVDSQLLFQRFIAAANGSYDDKTEIFSYELSSQPSAMFDTSGLMRLAQKSSLGEAIWNLGDCSATESETVGDGTRYVIDGGSLLHRIPWTTGQTFGDICKRYTDYVCNRYKKAVIVFDGYESGPDTKDAIHLRRTKGLCGTEVKFNKSTPFRSKKDVFLANHENKQNFINMLGAALEESGMETNHGKADADPLIAKSAISSSKTNPTVLLGEDTDLLVLLLYHAEQQSYPLYFRSDLKKKNTRDKIWDIRKAKDVLGLELCTLLPVIHAISGCDTTSRLFGIGKGLTLKKVSNNEFMRSQAHVFISNHSSKSEIITAGENLIALLYSGLQYEGLDLLRYRKFANSVLTNKTFLQIHTLPPTSSATAFHSQRTYLQVQTWIEGTILDPCEWGWCLSNDRLMPVKTDKAPAPDRLLMIIRCKCKKNCDTRKCTCRKHGLDCSPVCSDCKGNSCSNSKILDILEQD